MKNKISEKLISLLQKHSHDVDGHIWLFEQDRFEELLFCLISQIGNRPKVDYRKLLLSLKELELLPIEHLSEIKRNSKEYNFIIELMDHFGLDDLTSKKMCDLMISASKIVIVNYGGRIQILLRVFGEIIRDQMKQTFKEVPLKDKELDYAITLWLQNVLQLPLSLKQKELKIFCKKNKISYERLLRESDELNINIAALDDLFAIESEKK